MASEHHFRNVDWGMSREEVRANETATFLDEGEDGSLVYLGTIVGREAAIYYRFTDDVLDGAGYFIDSDSDVMDVAAYDKLHQLLEKKYGEPEVTELEQKYPGKKMSLETYGELAEAIASGLASLRALWTTDDSLIHLTCNEDPEEHNVHVRVLYKDRTTIEVNSDQTFEGDIDNI